jgi:hypothetical protein
MILAPHPELAKLYLDLRPGDSNADRLLLCIVRHCFVPPASSIGSPTPARAKTCVTAQQDAQTGFERA